MSISVGLPTEMFMSFAVHTECVFFDEEAHEDTAPANMWCCRLRLAQQSVLSGVRDMVDP